MAIRFPGETADYRKARDALLAAELELSNKQEEVARLRRKLPLGGEVSDDYVFHEGPDDLARDAPVREVKLSQLFAPRKDTLALYSFMYGPQMEQPCPMCTSFLDSLDRTAPHATQRINLVIAAKSPIARIRAFAKGRGWTSFRLVSTEGTTYNHDYHGETERGSQMPTMNVFVRRDGAVHHFWSSEALFAEHPQGEDSRHIDLLWPLWNLFDLTPEGRGSDWYPKLAY